VDLKGREKKLTPAVSFPVIQALDLQTRHSEASSRKNMSSAIWSVVLSFSLPPPFSLSLSLPFFLFLSLPFSFSLSTSVYPFLLFFFFFPALRLSLRNALQLLKEPELASRTFEHNLDIYRGRFQF
jgi:hypothetical protein